MIRQRAFDFFEMRCALRRSLFLRGSEALRWSVLRFAAAAQRGKQLFEMQMPVAGLYETRTATRVPKDDQSEPETSAQFASNSCAAAYDVSRPGRILRCRMWRGL